MRQLTDSEPDRAVGKEIWPNFFIVGAAKAGTTSLYEYLKQHLQVYMSPVKEPHFFSRVSPLPEQRHLVRPVRNERDYLALFAAADGFKAIGEASPSYLWDEHTARRIADKVPEARIIVLLRDPIERAFSHYLMDVREGLQTRPFYEALLEDMAREPKGWGVSHLYVELGMYGTQLARYLSAFGRSQVLILQFEDLRRDPRSVVAEAARFLGLDDFEPDIVLEPHNPFAVARGRLARQVMASGRGRRVAQLLLPGSARRLARRSLLMSADKPPLDTRALTLLRSTYAPEITTAEELLGRPLPELRLNMT